MSSSTTAASTVSQLIYGTAWKKLRTAELVEQAIRLGFRRIDTACQPKHYHEKGVGEAIAKVADLVKRDQLFLQTKFTPLSGQDTSQPLPYDANAPLERQVEQSVQKSLQNLDVSRIDSLLMHSPMHSDDDTLRVWRAFEKQVDSGVVSQIGISNIYDFRKFEKLWQSARIKPAVVQNRFYADSGFDVQIRAFCRANEIEYQSFWTLTANPTALKSKIVKSLAAKYKKTVEQILFRFLLYWQVTPLTGTTSEEHMRSDLDVKSFELTNDEQTEMKQLFEQ